MQMAKLGVWMHKCGDWQLFDAVSEPEPGQDLKDSGSGAIEQNVPGGAGAVGKEALVEFVGGCDQECAEHGQEVGVALTADCSRGDVGDGNEARGNAAGGCAQAHAKGAKPGQGKDSVSEEMTSFADVMVEVVPRGIGELVMQNEFEKVADWPGGTICAE